MRSVVPGDFSSFRDLERGRDAGLRCVVGLIELVGLCFVGRMHERSTYIDNWCWIC